MHSSPRKVAVVNQKGGVGKTTTVVNLAAALAQRDLRVLVLDCDPQSNATQFLGLTSLPPSVFGSARMLLGRGSSFEPTRTSLPGVDVVPATEDLAYVETELLTDPLAGGVLALSNALRDVEDQYDFILADCPPTVGLLALNAMVACPEVLIPARLSGASIAGALFLRERTIDRLRLRAAPAVRILGVLGTFYSETARSPRQVLGHLKSAFGDLVFSTVIHSAQSIDDSAALGLPIVAARPNSRGAAQYHSLTEEVICRG